MNLLNCEWERYAYQEMLSLESAIVLASVTLYLISTVGCLRVRILQVVPTLLWESAQCSL